MRSQPSFPLANEPCHAYRVTPAHDAAEFCVRLAMRGEKVLFRYFQGGEICEMTYAAFAEEVRRLAGGLTALGLAGRRIAVIGETSPRWLATYFAVLASGGVIVPLDRELDDAAIVGFLTSVEASAIVHAEGFTERFASLPFPHCLTHRIAMTGDEKAGYDAVLARCPDDYRFPPVSDITALAELLFTSGTTGTSKCVMLSQQNIFASVNGVMYHMNITGDDVSVSILPVHHTLEICCLIVQMSVGVTICINDSIPHLMRNLKLFRPTGLLLVPLIVQTMYKRIWAEAEKKKMAGKLKAGLRMSALALKMGVDKRETLFAEVLAAFGGRLKKIICGGAPLDPELVCRFEEFGVHIYEGYGITECSPVVTFTPYYARRYGSVGTPLSCCEVRIAEVSKTDSGYAEGEILVKGDNVMLGYLNNPEANAAAFTEDGWFRTGDIGYLDRDGYLYITGRLKSVIVLHNGKNVFPEEIEERMNDIEGIAECVVVGRPRPDGEVALTAVVYPDLPDDQRNTEGYRMAHDRIAEAVRSMNRRLPAFKQVKEVEIRTEPFEKTTSHKIKRHLVK